VQEIHLVAIHLLCSAFDHALDELGLMGEEAGRFTPTGAGSLR
jgi:hypothetical protein